MAEQERTSHIKEIQNFLMFAKPVNAESKSPKLTWGIRMPERNPRITVFTNVKNSQGNNGIIYAGFDPRTFLIFLDLFEKAAIGEAGKQYKIDCYSSFDLETKTIKQNERFLVSEVNFGKDDFGIVWLKLTAPNQPDIRFEYTVSDYHKIFKADGTAINKAESSQLQAVAVIRALKSIYNQIFGNIDGNEPNVVTYQQSTAPQKTQDNISFDDDIGF